MGTAREESTRCRDIIEEETSEGLSMVIATRARWRVESWAWAWAQVGVEDKSEIESAGDGDSCESVV